jgi:hypothetical protein
MNACLSVEHAPLPNGSHTAFEAGQCIKCKKLMGFPSENLVMFLTQGNPDAVEELYNKMDESLLNYEQRKLEDKKQKGAKKNIFSRIWDDFFGA